MGGRGDRSERSTTVAQALDAIGGRLRAPDQEPVTGASLLLVVYCRVHGIPLDDEDVDRIARFLDMTSEAVSEVVRFHDLAVRSASDEPGPMVLCRGTNCSLHGADRIYPQLKCGFESQGMRRAYEEVYCLGQCEHGPSIMVDRHVYCGRAQHVVRDDRHWRDEF